MDARGLIPILNVSNMDASFAWFEQWGWRKLWDWGDPPDFGAVGSGACQIFQSLDSQGGRGRGDLPRTFGPGNEERSDRGVWMSIWVDDVDAVHALCVREGLEVTLPPTDMPWEVREMHLRHPDGHVFRVGRGIGYDESVEEQRLREAGPPLAIERVDVPVRLERRLAALLADLAAHKRMSIAETLEETLLHTFEEIGEGVASPHTHRTLAHIRELRSKHGIDYDCHASYRFVEQGRPGRGERS